jgi:hypothetical protein
LSGGFGGGVAGLALYGADEEALEDFAGFVAVADVFEGFGGVLAADVEHYFFTATEEGKLVGGFLCADGWGDCLGEFVFLVIPHEYESGGFGWSVEHVE